MMKRVIQLLTGKNIKKQTTCCNVEIKEDKK